MKRIHFVLALLSLCLASAAQEVNHNHSEDSTDIFFRHLKLNELTVTGVTGDTKLKHATAPVSVVSPQVLRATASTNIIDAIARQPGVSQLTTGGSISKPIIRGLGYNRVVVMSEGVRQEGQQWGDEHGVEVDGGSVGSVEILKGPASLMYGSDAMAGVVIMHAPPSPEEGAVRANVSTEYQTNNGLFAYRLAVAGKQRGFVWDGRFSDKMAHAYKNKYDGYVPGSQFRERAGRLMVGLDKTWGHSRLTWTAYHLTPGIAEGGRDEATGELERPEGSPTSYAKSLPFQQVKHYKAVWDNMLNLPSGYVKAVVGYQQNRRQEFEESEDEYGIFLKLHTLTYDLRYVTGEWEGWKLSTGVGGMYQRSVNDGEELLIPDSHLFDFGLYATATKSLGDRWTFSGGVRYDHRRLKSLAAAPSPGEEAADGAFTRRFGAFTGSVGAVCNISENFNLRMNLARGFRTPNISELASDGVHEGSLRYEIGDPQLKAEYSLQADLGIDFTSRYVSAQLALFANRIDNYIFIKGEGRTVQDGAVAYPVYSYTQDDARLLGFEAGVDFHPVHSLHFSNSFSYVDARLTSCAPTVTPGAKYLPFTPAPRWMSELKWELLHHSHSTINHHHSPLAPRHSLLLNNLYVAAGLDCYMKQDHIYSADDTETATPAYALLNLSAGTDVQVKGRKVAELYVIADNVLDRACQNHLSRLKYADENVVTGRRGVFDMGRNVTFKVVVPIN